MFGVVVLEDYVTLMAHLAEEKKTKQNNNMLLTKCQGGKRTPCECFGVLSCDLQTLDCVIAARTPASKHPAGRESVDLADGGGWQRLACVTHQDEGVGFPVGGGDLICQPRGDSLGRLDTEF